MIENTKETTVPELDALLVRFRTLNHFTRSYQEDEQLGLLYIATYSRLKGGYAVRVLDEYSISLELLCRTLTESRAKVVGFYCDHENIWAILTAIRVIRERIPEVLCVAGGPQVSASPWDKRIFQESPVDVAVIGEGEHAFLEILDSFIRGSGRFSSIAGINYRDGDEVIATNGRKAEANLDVFPFPDRNLNYYGKKANGNENIITARGCPGMCAFCFEGRQVGVRARSVNSVLEEVEMLLRDRNMVYLAILDDLFTLNAKRVIEICDGFKSLQEKYHDFKWFCEGRVDIISKHPEIAQAMQEAGLIRLQIGVESGNQRILDAYRKGITLEQITECVDICYEADILSVIGNVIIGGAFEDNETIQNTIEFVCKLMARAPGCYDFNTTIFTPYPGTAIYKHPEDYGLNIIDPDCVTGMGDNYAFSETESLSKWQILDARHRVMEAFETVATSLIPGISDERKLRHFQAFYLYGIQTVWFQAMATQNRFYNYYGLQVSSGKHTVRSVADETLFNMKPIRTISIGSSVDGQLVLPFLDTPIRLGRFGGRIFELCCGKLTTAQIVDSLHSDLLGEVSREKISEYVITTLRRLDDEKLVLMSET